MGQSLGRWKGSPSGAEEALGLKVGVGGDDGAQALLGGFVAAIGVGVVDLHQRLIGLLDGNRVGRALDAKGLEGAAVVLMQRADALGLRAPRLGALVAGKDVERVVEAALLPVGTRGAIHF